MGIPRLERVAGCLLVGLLPWLCLSCRSLPEQHLCRLRPLHVGVCSLGADHVLGGEHSADERLTFALLAFLVEGPDGQVALVDLGPMSLEYSNAMFRRYGFFRDLGPGKPPEERYPDDIRQPHGNIFRQLRAAGVAVEDVDHIVFTHLHADHHGMDDATDGGAGERFGEATLHVSRRGWDENLEKRRDGEWGSYVDFAFGDFLLRREARGTVSFADNETVFPGLSTLYLGGHSPCSQAVVVETAQGTAIITSDDVYHYSLLERNVLPAIYTSPGKFYRAVERLVRLAERTDGILVPIHDPEVWKAYEERGEEWLDALRPLSDRAVKGYRRASAELGVRFHEFQ